MKVQELLDNQGAEFETCWHDETFTAQRLAHAMHVSGDNVAKSVVLKTNEGFIVAVVPASCYVNLQEARRALDAESVRLATETELSELFPDCQLGAIPPFGSQYGLKTVVDRSLTVFDEILFEGNRHDEVITMHFRDFERIEHPLVAEFARHL